MWNYDDPDHPDRVTSVTHDHEWTDLDRSLIIALQSVENGMCPGGDHPIAVAWHSDMDGYYDEDGIQHVLCYACTAQRGDEVSYAVGTHTRDLQKKPLRPFDINRTVTRPEKKRGD